MGFIYNSMKYVRGGGEAIWEMPEVLLSSKSHGVSLISLCSLDLCGGNTFLNGKHY